MTSDKPAGSRLGDSEVYAASSQWGSWVSAGQDGAAPRRRDKPAGALGHERVGRRWRIFETQRSNPLHCFLMSPELSRFGEERVMGRGRGFCFAPPAQPARWGGGLNQQANHPRRKSKLASPGRQSSGRPCHGPDEMQVPMYLGAVLVCLECLGTRLSQAPNEVTAPARYQIDLFAVCNKSD